MSDTIFGVGATGPINTQTLPDSGNRRQFESGAVRDIAEGKGRCDLLPLDTVASYFGFCGEDDVNCAVMNAVAEFVKGGNAKYLYSAIQSFIYEDWTIANLAKEPDIWDALLEVSKHYEAGALKYSDRNWEKGIPLHCFIDSGLRHYFKYKRGDKDEPHDRAFIWNMLGAAWTYTHHPELDDITGDRKYGKRADT